MKETHLLSVLAPRHTERVFGASATVRRTNLVFGGTTGRSTNAPYLVSLTPTNCIQDSAHRSNLPEYTANLWKPTSTTLI
jgi:hypothetical protein